MSKNTYAQEFVMPDLLQAGPITRWFTTYTLLDRWSLFRHLLEGSFPSKLALPHPHQSELITHLSYQNIGKSSEAFSFFTNKIYCTIENEKVIVQCKQLFL